MTQYQPPPPPGDPQGPGGYYQQQQPQKRGSGMAVTALVLGAIALLTSWSVIGGILFGLAAVVLGAIASGRAKRGQAGGRGMAITGIVLGLVSIVISVVIVVAIGAFWNSDTVQEYRDCLEQAGTDQAALAECENSFSDDVRNQVG